jgi:hypothetical protein
MKAQTLHHHPKPAEQAANRRRKAVAKERVARHAPPMLAGLDPETFIETCREGIRALSQAINRQGGQGRASGVLCGALVDVAPGYGSQVEREAADKLFNTGSET